MINFTGHMRFPVMVALSVLAVAALLSFAGDAQAAQVYWGTDGDSIERANLDGSGHEILMSGLDWPIGIALDGRGGKMYWTDAGQNTIHRANLDGSGVEDVSPASTNFPAGIALDLQAGKMYWAERDGSKIQRANLDGSNSQVLVSDYDGSPHQFIAVELHLAAGKIYWAEDSTNLGRADLDGTNPETIVTGLGSPNDIALDLRAGKIYWTDDTSVNIARSNLDGSDIENLSSVEAVGGQPWGIAVDALAGKMYWGNQGLDRIQRANVDGTEVEDLVTNVPRIFAVTLDLSTRDWDGDGLLDIDEDADGDGVKDPTETDPDNPDSDGDGLNDGQEVNTYLTNPNQADTDGDGLNDRDEVLDLDPVASGIQNPFDPLNPDSTGDGFQDTPDAVPDGHNDYDGDGMSNADEFTFGYNPMDPGSWSDVPLFAMTGLCALVVLLGARALAARRSGYNCA